MLSHSLFLWALIYLCCICTWLFSVFPSAIKFKLNKDRYSSFHYSSHSFQDSNLLCGPIGLNSWSICLSLLNAGIIDTASTSGFSFYVLKIAIQIIKNRHDRKIGKRNRSSWFKEHAYLLVRHLAIAFLKLV